MIPIPTPTALLFILYTLHIYLQLIVYLCNLDCNAITIPFKLRLRLYY